MSTLNKSDVDCRIVDATDGALTLDELIALSATDTAALFISPYGVIKGGRVVANVTNSADFVKTSDVVSDAATPNTVVGRDEQGDIYTRCIVDDSGLFCAFPYSVEQTKNEADYILQEEISDLETIRLGAKKGATSVQASDVSTSGEPNKVVRLDENAGIAARLFHDTDSDLTWAFPRSTEEATEWADGVLQEQIEDLEEIREGAKNSLPATIEYNEYTFTGKVTTEVKNESATIGSVKGNSVVWNNPIKNKVDTTEAGTDGWYNRGKNNVSVTFDGDLITQVTTTSATNIQLSQNVGFTQYHKYYILWEWDYPEETFTLETDNEIRFRAQTDRNGTNSIYISYSYEAKGKYETIWEQTSSGFPFISVLLRRYTNFLLAQSWTIRNRIKVYDLTQMFGAGNEPTTVEEFYARKPIGVDENAYNEGEIINGNYKAILSRGFNQWDEQWEVGSIDSNGVLVNSTRNIRSKNYIPVLPNTQYYIKSTENENVALHEYDANFNHIKYFGVVRNTKITTSSNAAYFKFRMVDGYGATYNNDICINISDDSKNGTYEPYVESTCDSSWVKRYFPNGMRSAGSVRDEIRYNSTTNKWEVVQRVGTADLGSLSYNNISERTNTYRAIGYIQLKKNVSSSSTIHIVSTYNLNYPDYYWQNDEVGVCDLLSQDRGGIVVGVAKIGVSGTSESIATALQGVMLNYELAEPIVTEIAPYDIKYNAYEGGTEVLLTDSATTPIIAEIGYNYDARRQIETLSQSVGSMLGGSADAIRLADGSTITFDELKTKLGL